MIFLFQIEDDGVYVPLQRPTVTREQKKVEIPVDDFSADEEDDFEESEDSDDCFKNKRQKSKRTVLVRSSAKEDSSQKSKFKKYQVWATTLEEDSLTENMRGFGVAHNSRNDRSVETYDYDLKYRLEGRKRHLSDNEHSEESDGPSNKRCKSSYSYRPKKRPVKERLGPKKHSSESSDLECEPRILTNLTKGENDEPESIAREIAYNLCEEKDDLIRKYLYFSISNIFYSKPFQYDW